MINHDADDLPATPALARLGENFDAIVDHLRDMSESVETLRRLTLLLEARREFGRRPDQIN
jgi:hypothetical protein